MWSRASYPSLVIPHPPANQQTPTCDLCQDPNLPPELPCIPKQQYILVTESTELCGGLS